MNLKSEKIVYKRYRTVTERIYINQHGEEEIWEVYGGRNGACCIFPLTVNNEVILVTEFRPGVDKELTDIPGGAIDEGESPIIAAKRELEEETGYTSSKILDLGQFYVDSYDRTPNSAILALDCTPVVGLQPEFKVTIVPLVQFFEQFQLLNTVSPTTILIVREYLRDNKIL